MPFIGGWIGYTYAPGKIVEVEKVVTITSSKNFIGISTSTEPYSETSVFTADSTEEHNWVTNDQASPIITFEYPQSWYVYQTDSDSRSSVVISREDLYAEVKVSSTTNQRVTIRMVRTAEDPFFGRYVCDKEEFLSRIQKTVKVCHNNTGTIVEYNVEIEKQYGRVTGIEFVNLDPEFIIRFVNSIRIKETPQLD